MRKIYIITAILISFQLHAKSQNWDLFPIHQYSMFEISFNNQPSSIERIIKDSISVYKDSTLFYFNSKWNSNAKCSSVIDNKNLADEYSISYLKLDSCVEINYWHYYYSFNNGGVKFKFNGHAKLNESWIASGNIIIKCDSVTQKLIFGQLDSVKYFSNSKVNSLFVLSKTYGLLEFAPFGQLIYADSYDIGKASLIGFDHFGVKIGTNIPEFKDFFHLKTGDVVFWNCHYNSWVPSEQAIDYYYKDSITNAIITSDSVIYEINSIRDNYIIKDKQSFYKEKLANFLNPNSSMGFFSNDDPIGIFSDYLLYWQCINIANDDKYFSLTYMWSSLLLDTTSCTLNRIIDAGGDFSIDTRVGLSKYNEFTVVGAVMDGEKWGMTKIPTAILQNSTSLNKIYPNPCYDKLYIQLSNSANVEYKLFNINGQLLKEGKLDKGYIDLANLQNGIYNVRIFNYKTLITRKIIKENNR